MAAPLLYAEDHYVVLRPQQSELFLTAAEMLDCLTTIVREHPLDCLNDRSIALSQDLINASPVTQAQTIAQALLDRTCELHFGSGDWIQWYAVRLERE